MSVHPPLDKLDHFALADLQGRAPQRAGVDIVGLGLDLLAGDAHAAAVDGLAALACGSRKARVLEEGGQIDQALVVEPAVVIFSLRKAWRLRGTARHWNI